MAKKIIIEFSDQPVTTGPGFSYTISVGAFDIYYSNGTAELKVEFLDNGDTPVNYYDVPIGLTLSDTLIITLNFLRQNYINDLIEYSLVGNTIEVLVQAEATVVVSDLINTYIDITVIDVEPSGINLIYYLIFDDYVLNIYKRNYLGTSSEIHGTFTITKSPVDSILSPIRGTGLNISLEANPSLTFDEFLLNDEFTYKTELIKSGNIIFEGYIKPDGIQQSFVNDEWLINIEANDVLGALKDLSFVQANGLQFTGKMSVYDVIKGCLDRTRLTLTINTFVNIEYIGYAGANILKDIYVSSDRFIKDKDDTVIMDCNEVLTSMLNLFSAIVSQQDGQWWILRPNDLELNGSATFINQDNNTTFLKNLNAVLGSQINNFYPHHCGANQQIEVKGAISAYRINYEYGFIEGFIKNPNLNHTDLEYDFWTVNPSLPANILIDDVTRHSGAVMIPIKESLFSLVEVLSSDTFAVLAGDILTFRTKVSTFLNVHRFSFKIKTSDGYFLNKNNEWVLGESTNPNVQVFCGKLYRASEFSVSFELLMPPVLNDCTIQVIICRPMIEYPPSTMLFSPGLSIVSFVDIVNNENQRRGIEGEFHTVTRFKPPSSITKENQKVFNGDGGLELIGSIFKSDQETLTDLWSRKNKFENLPLLGISAMDDLRIQSNPIQVFSGDVFGEMPYLSVVSINNITGLFMFIEYSFDPKQNIIQHKLLQFYNSDLADIQYQVSPNYGNSTIKPTIKG